MAAQLAHAGIPGVFRQNLIDQTGTQRGFSRNHGLLRQPPVETFHPDTASQPRAAAPTRRQSEPALREPEGGLRNRDNVIEGAEQFHPATKSGTIHQDESRRRKRLDPAEDLVHAPGHGQAVFGGHQAREGFQIPAQGEIRAVATQDEHRLRLMRIQGRVQGGHACEVDGVVRGEGEEHVVRYFTSECGYSLIRLH